MLTFQTNSNDPFYNQAFEEFVFQTFREDDVFFLWQNRPAVVVGSFQNICREVHAAMLWEQGIPVPPPDERRRHRLSRPGKCELYLYHPAGGTGGL